MTTITRRLSSTDFKCKGGDPRALQIGLGQYGRGSHELLLLAVRGRQPVAPECRSPSVVFAERTRHSRKPERAFEVVELASPEPRLEVFGRTERPGWVSVGNETSGGDVRDDLAELQRRTR